MGEIGFVNAQSGFCKEDYRESSKYSHSPWGMTHGFAIVCLLIDRYNRSESGNKDHRSKEQIQCCRRRHAGKRSGGAGSPELPMLPENGEVDSYIERIGSKLAEAIPVEFRKHFEFRYDFSVVNARDINAFALPGGPMFVNRGMIEAAKSEGEMAGAATRANESAPLPRVIRSRLKVGG